MRALYQHVEIADDHREIVVEAERQPSGQPTDRVHPLGLAQLLFYLEQLGHITADRHDATAPCPMLGDLQNAAVR